MVGNEHTSAPDEKTDSTDRVSLSGKPGLLSLFRKEAIRVHGARGVSKAGQEAMRDWLAKQGVAYSDETDSGTDEESELLQLCRNAKARGVDPRKALTDALASTYMEAAAQP